MKEMKIKLLERYFAIEDGEYYKGYDNGNRWNGWACPLFEKSIAHKICRAATDNETVVIKYDGKEDCFIIKSLDNSFEDECYKGKDYEINGENKHLYSIGSGLWCWDSYTREEVYKSLKDDIDYIMTLIENVLGDAPDEEQCGELENDLYSELANVLEYKDRIDDIIEEKINYETDKNLSVDEPDICDED